MRAILIILIVIYWAIIGFVFAPQLSSPMNDQGFSSTGNLSSITPSQPTGVALADVLQIIGIALWGIGLPASVPIWFSLPFAIWQIGIFIVFLIALIA